MPKVSVLLPIRNAESYVERCLQSVFAQTFTDFEVVAVDDGSTDDTLRKLDELGSDTRLRAFTNRNMDSGKPLHVGLARVCNQALALAKGEYAAFIAHDDLWLPTKLERELSTARTHGADVIYSDFILRSETGADSIIHISEFDIARLKRECYINASGALISRSAINALGEKAFDESLYSAMDWDFWIRLGQFARFEHLAETLSIYTRHRGQMSRGLRHDLAKYKVYSRYNKDHARYAFTVLIKPYLTRILHYPWKLISH